VSDEPRLSVQEETEPLPRPGRSRSWLPLVLAVAILLLGIVIGGSAVILFGRSLVVGHPGPAVGIPPDAVSRIVRDLAVTDDQRRAAEDAIFRRLRRIEDVRDKSITDIEAEFDGMREDVAKLLDEQQAKRWRERFDEARQEGFRPPPPIGPPDMGPGHPGGHGPGGGPGGEPGGGPGHPDDGPPHEFEPGKGQPPPAPPTHE